MELIIGPARAVFDAARRGPERMEWVTPMDVLMAVFDTPADCQEALRCFRAMRLGVGLDPRSRAMTLHGLLNRALPTVNEITLSEPLLGRFREILPEDLRR
ncbi:unnamed protein product [Echinostoma caproni]|uniref:Pentatricopeptide repeat-containing protein n=1 Tax=Echinostoma caproni TaxID=27848 RepID=A0A183BDS3_9TREM|nr:unnamed protein product [Echinostoma caproni]